MHCIKYQEENSKHKAVEATADRAVLRQWTISVRANAVQMVWELDNQCIKVVFFYYMFNRLFLKILYFLKLRISQNYEISLQD